jgi:hypothetical protein
VADHNQTQQTVLTGVEDGSPQPTCDSRPCTLPVPREAVVQSVGTSYWSVDEDQWDSVLPSLPDELVELLAPPVTVGALPCGES